MRGTCALASLLNFHCNNKVDSPTSSAHCSSRDLQVGMQSAMAALLARIHFPTEPMVSKQRHLGLPYTAFCQAYHNAKPHAPEALTSSPSSQDAIRSPLQIASCRSLFAPPSPLAGVRRRCDQHCHHEPDGLLVICRMEWHRGRHQGLRLHHTQHGWIPD